MKQFAPFILIGLAAVTFVLLLAGSDSYSRIGALRHTRDQQRLVNERLNTTVQQARQEVYGLEHDKRELEKAARNGLGMAKANETIYLFDK